METRTLTNGKTELYAGGGKILTQSGPTHSHTFTPSVVLPSADNAAKWREVTPQERTVIEAQDAAWTRPPQAFIDRWNTRAGEYGCYNESTGLFELNGITDIGYEEALRIDAVSTWPASVLFGNASYPLARDTKVRTVFPLYIASGNSYSLAFFAPQNATLEVLRLTYPNGTSVCSDMRFAFNYAWKLKKIEGELILSSTVSNLDSNSFAGCWSLKEVRIRGLAKDLNMAHCPLSLATVDYLITNRAGTNAITVTLSPTVYAKIMDEANEEWHALLDKAASKNITIATTN